MAPRTGPPPPASVRNQRIVAVILTVLLFGLVIVGAGAGFAVFGHRWWGYLVGVAACVVMGVAGFRARNR